MVIVVGIGSAVKACHSMCDLKNVSIILTNVIIYNKNIRKTSFLFIFFGKFINFAS